MHFDVCVRLCVHVISVVCMQTNEYALQPYTRFVMPSHECQCKFVFLKSYYSIRHISFSTRFEFVTLEHWRTHAHKINIWIFGLIRNLNHISFSTIKERQNVSNRKSENWFCVFGWKIRFLKSREFFHGWMLFSRFVQQNSHTHIQKVINKKTDK